MVPPHTSDQTLTSLTLPIRTIYGTDEPSKEKLVKLENLINNNTCKTPYLIKSGKPPSVGRSEGETKIDEKK